MLFPLSLIGGTPLQRRAHEYGMRSYDEKSLKTIQLVCDIEYRNIALYKDFSLIDLERFDDLALAIFYFYNRFRLSLAYLSKRLDGGAAALFEAVGREIKVFLRARGIRATNANVIDGFEDVIKSVFIEQAKGAGAQAVELAAFEELFKLDIFRILVADSPHREKLFKGFKSKVPVAENIAPILDTDSVRRIAHGKIVHCNFQLSDLNRLHELRESIRQAKETVYICAPFHQWKTIVIALTELDCFLLDIIPADRPIRFGQLAHAVKRRADFNIAQIKPALDSFAGLGILEVG